MAIVKLLAVIAALLVLLSKKVNMALSLFISAVLLILISGQGLPGIYGAAAATVADPVTYVMMFTILFIGILGYLMNQYGMLQRMVDYLEKLVRSAKVTIMLAPTLIGLLLVTGGALMSCPIVDTLGQRLNLPNTRRAAINMIFRHGLYFAYPLSATMILASQLGGFDLGTFIWMQIPVTIFFYVLGYFVYIHGVGDVKGPRLSANEFARSLGGFLLYSLPITITIIMAVCGVPFERCLPVGILTAVVIYLFDCRKNPSKKHPENPFKLIFKGINWKMLFIILAVLLFKNAIAGVQEISEYIVSVVSRGVPMELVIIIICVLVTFPTGNMQPSMAVAYPFIMLLGPTMGEVLLYSYILNAVGFLCYYLAPVHMCQVLSIDYFKITVPDLMKSYKVFMPILAVAITVWYFALRLILL